METMTIKQEAYTLIMQQPDGNVRILVDLMKAMSSGVHALPNRQATATRTAKRTGIARGTVDFPSDFDEHFDDLNSEIAEMFVGEAK